MKNLNEISKALIKRRNDLSLDQTDMKSRIGMSQQQYSKLESSGEMRLSTLLRVLEGLELEIKFIPKEHLKIEAFISDQIEKKPENLDKLLETMFGKNLEEIDKTLEPKTEYDPESFESKLKALADD
ncbi:XRE family transcriptional regulator [Hydrogenovibrio crunogenus]|uniref:XRE family transcriptional regulator n=1 Tax=Hydrogenovibrio crunogenus TaxID=39765 RepID=A0A4P7P1F1_9GAMM|nr:helix-turn-helix transcriptional regulator [Hydrogenovibrio crunogenus]QBZ83846.1 XRE family transcriptional regulator [Hydrogenovibrio crunogenus]